MLTGRSRGSVTLASADTFDAPLVDPNWQVDPADVDQAIAGFWRIREIASKCAAIEREVWPGPSVNSTEAIMEYLRQYMTTIYHGASSCESTSCALVAIEN